MGPTSREYVQPQWILDSANFNFCLPIKKYSVGSELPPHLSPWVDDGEEGYVPKYKEEVERLRNGELLEVIEAEESLTIEKEETAVETSSSSEEEDTVPSSNIPQKNNTPEQKESER